MRRNSTFGSVLASSISRVDVAADEHRLQDALLDVDVALLLIELPQLLVRPHHAELLHGFGAQLGVVSLVAAARTRARSPETMNARRIWRLTSTSVDDW